MPPRINIAENRDFVLETLRSEITADGGCLAAWVRRLQSCGAIDSLFRLETWLRGLRSFFSLDHIPLGETEIEDLVGRSFAAEIGIIRTGIQTCEALGFAVIQADAKSDFQWEAIIRTRLRRVRMPDFHVSRTARQLSPRDSVVELLDFLNDLSVTMDAVRSPSALNYPYFRSLGRCFERGLRSCPYVDRLLSRRSRPQYDSIGGPLAQTLGGIPDGGVRRGVTLALLHLFRILKYLALIAEDLDRDRPLKQDLVLFSLVHKEMNLLADFLRDRFIREGGSRHPWGGTAERVAYSLRMEAQRVLRRELIFVSGEADPSAIYTKIENSHGLLRNCSESCVTALLEAADANFDPAALFPYKAKQKAEAEKLRRDLETLRQWLTDILGNREELDANRIAERLTSFKKASLRSLMHRDWAEFESLLDALTLAGSFIEARTHIRKFVAFLEMLIQEISKRSVLQAQTRPAEAASTTPAR
jgi:hypothetical protein